MKLLIVDDDTRNIFALKAVLKAKGYQCESAPGAQEALDMLRNDNGYTAILMDMMMPDMDGYQAMPLIRAHESLRGIPIIAVTAQAMKGDKEKCLEAGADAYISKPIDIDELTTILSELGK